MIYYVYVLFERASTNAIYGFVYTKQEKAGEKDKSTIHTLSS